MQHGALRRIASVVVGSTAFFLAFSSHALAAAGTCTAAARGIASFACPGTPTQDVCGAAPNYSCYANASEPVCGANQAFDCNTCSCACGAGYTNCSGTCVANLQCPSGLTANTCAQTCTTPYVLLSPAAPQTGGVQVTGDIKTTNGDVYLPSAKAIRVDGNGTTNLYMGNWAAGSGGFALNIQGTVYADTISATQQLVTLGDLFMSDGTSIRVEGKLPTTLAIANGLGGSGSVTLAVDGAVTAQTVDASQSVTAPSFCLGASCIHTWPSGGGGGGGGNGTITGVTAGTGLLGGGSVGSVQLDADTNYFDARYVNVTGNEVMNGSLTAAGVRSTVGGAFGGYSIDPTWLVSTPNGYFGNGVKGTIIGAGAGQAAGDITTDGVLFAKTSLHAPTVTADTQLCIGATCKNAWPATGITQEVDTLDAVMQRGNQTGVGDLVLGVGSTSASLTLDDGADLRWVHFGKSGNVGFYNSPTQFDVEPMLYLQGGMTVQGGTLSATVPVQITNADVTVQGGKVLATGAGSGICTDTQAANCTGANAPTAGTVKATKLCLPGVAPTGGCINDWTIGGNGDITDVTAGNGLTGGGSAGAVTLQVGAGQGISVAADTVALDSTYTDTLYVKKTGDAMSGKLTIANSSQAPGSYGVDVSGTTGAGLFSNSLTGASAQLGSGSFGVIGNSGGSAGTGVYGATGSGVGVSGYATAGGYAVQGYASGTATGVGVYGEGDKYGVFGQSLHQNGYALYGIGRLYVTGAATLNGGVTVSGAASVSGSLDTHGLTVTNGNTVVDNLSLNAGHTLSMGGVSYQQWPVWSAPTTITNSGVSAWKTFDCPNNLYTLVSYTCFYGITPTGCATKYAAATGYQLSVYIPANSSATVSLNCQL